MIEGRLIIGLPVVTRSGQHLGRIASFELDPSDHRICRYLVRTTWSLRKPFGEELVVAPAQIVALTVKAMVVDDLTVPRKSLTSSPEVAPTA